MRATAALWGIVVAGVLSLPADRCDAKDDWPEAADAPSKVKPGQTRLLRAPKGMSYFLRVPKDYDAKKGARLVVWLHGSNMNGMAYVGSFEAKGWCADDLLVCPNGEEVADAAKHVHNFTFGSAPLVADLTEEVQKAFKTQATYVGGHSQGGFLTYSVITQFPDLYQGAIPFAGDCWSQNEPYLWDDQPDLQAKQRRIPIAVIHGKDDPVVQFAQGQHAYDCFRAALWTRLRFFSPDGIGHMFMPAPIDHALAWLDAMNGREEKRSLGLVDDWMKAGEWGWATEAAAALAAAPGATPAAKNAPSRVAKAAEAPAKKAAAEMKAAMDAEAPLAWVPKWMEFHRIYGPTAPAKSLVDRYEKAREKERAEGRRLCEGAWPLFRAGQRADGFAQLRKVLEEAPHSYHGCVAAWELNANAAEAGTGGGGGKKKGR